MNETTVSIHCNHHAEGHNIRAWITATPGLVVHRAGGHCPDDLWIRDDYDEMGHSWVVTHARSGLALGFRADPESAMKSADALGALGDWTQSGQRLAETVAAHSVSAHVDIWGSVPSGANASAAMTR